MALGELTSQLIAELVGTFLFVLTIPLAIVGIGSLHPIPVSFMLMAMVFSFADSSGAHFNPAITLAHFFLGKTSLPKAVRYGVVQVLGSVLGSLYATIIVGSNIPAPTTDNNLGAVWRTLLQELLFTFGIVTVMLHVSCSRQKRHDIFAFSLGMMVLSATFAVGGWTRGAFNPAAATGTQLVACMFGNCSPLLHVWIYWAAPCGGAVVGAILYRLLDTEQHSSDSGNSNDGRLESYH